jgi:tetratricopeptide (TPR) repeat protein
MTPVDLVGLFGKMAHCELCLGVRDAARELIARALAIDPLHPPTLRLQVRAAQGVHEQIAAHDALAHVVEGEERARLYAEVGDLLATELSETVQAIAAWREALKHAPGDHKLLHKCLDAHVAAHDWSQALQVLDELIDAERAPEVRARYRLTAGLVCRDELHRPDLALDYLRAALDDDPALERASQALEQLYTERRDWKELARHFRRALKQLGPDSLSDGKNQERVRLWSLLGELCAGPLSDFESATAALEVALRLETQPAEILERRKRLADLLVQAGPRQFEKSIVEHQQILRVEKDRVHSYRALKHLYLQTQQREKSVLCSYALEALARGEPDDARRVGEYRQRPFATARRPLSDDSWLRLRHPEEDPLLDLLFGLTAPVLLTAQAQTFKAAGLDRDEAIPPDDPHSYHKVLNYVCRVLGVPAPEAYARPEQREAVLFAGCTDGKEWVPVFLLGQPVVAPGHREADQVFELSRRVAQLRPERLLRLAAPHPELLSHLIEVAIALDAEQQGVPLPGDVARTAEWLKRALGPAIEQVAAIGARLQAGGVRPDPAAIAWLKATDLTGLRAGWALAGDLGAGARSLATEGPTAAAHPQTQRLLELVWASTTEELFSVRRQLGLM